MVKKLHKKFQVHNKADSATREKPNNTSKCKNGMQNAKYRKY